jgi:hypothetical protein
MEQYTMLSQTYSIDYGFPMPKTLELGDKTSFDIVICVVEIM